MFISISAVALVCICVYTSEDLSTFCLFVFSFLYRFYLYLGGGISVYGRDGVLPQWVFSGKEGGWKKMPAKDKIQATIP